MKLGVQVTNSQAAATILLKLVVPPTACYENKCQYLRGQLRSKVILKTFRPTRWVLRTPLRDAFSSQRVPHQKRSSSRGTGRRESEQIHRWAQ